MLDLYESSQASLMWREPQRSGWGCLEIGTYTVRGMKLQGGRPYGSSGKVKRRIKS